MLRRLSVCASHIRMSDLLRGLLLCLKRKNPVKDFERELSGFLHSRYCFTTGSGSASLGIILKTLSGISGGREVIVPAYTHSELENVIRKLGLKVVCCDVSQDSFDFNRSSLSRLISKKTLCVVAVHSFGLPRDLNPVLELTRDRNVWLIEDFTRAFGSYYHERKVGAIGDAGFTGFDAESNFSTYSGGCIVTDNEELAGKFSKKVKELKSRGSIYGFGVIVRLMVLWAISNPVVYGLFPVLRNCFKTNGDNVDLRRFTGIQAAVGLAILKNILDSNIKRLFNGTFLMERLRNNKKLGFPKMPVYSRTVYNSMPIIFKDSDDREAARRLLLAGGIESSTEYLRLLKPLQNSKRLTGGILSLPVHEWVTEKDINTMVEILGSLGAGLKL